MTHTSKTPQSTLSLSERSQRMEALLSFMTDHGQSLRYIQFSLLSSKKDLCLSD